MEGDRGDQHDRRRGEDPDVREGRGEPRPYAPKGGPAGRRGYPQGGSFERVRDPGAPRADRISSRRRHLAGRRQEDRSARTLHHFLRNVRSRLRGSAGGGRLSCVHRGDPETFTSRPAGHPAGPSRGRHDVDAGTAGWPDLRLPRRVHSARHVQTGDRGDRGKEDPGRRAERRGAEVRAVLREILREVLREIGASPEAPKAPEAKETEEATEVRE